MLGYKIDILNQTDRRISFELIGATQSQYVAYDTKGFHCDCDYHSIKDPLCKVQCKFIKAILRNEEFQKWKNKKR